jgi:hypothetical protein
MDPRIKIDVPAQFASESRGTLGEAQYSFPTTHAQQALWYLDRLEPGNPAWNIAVRFRLRGPLHLEALERAINEIVRRHEILRTSFSFSGGAPVQIVHSTAFIPLPINDLSRCSSEQRDIHEEGLTIAEGQQSFDLRSGPLLRSCLLRFSEEEHVLLVTIHHIVSDGWSIGVFSDELAAHYADFIAGQQARLPALPLQYADYTIWQNNRLQSPALNEHISYWKGKLADLPLCEIPPDHARRPLKTHNGYILSVLLPVPLTDALTNFSRQHGCTFYTTALAALKMLIAHYARQNDIYVGTLLAGRDRAELEPLIGVFINTIVLRTDLSGDPTFLELLRRARQTFEEGLAHQDIHFLQVVEALHPKRDLSRPTLYGINFIYQRDFVKPIDFGGGLTMVPLPSKSPGAIYDLNFFMVQRSDGWRLSCEYNYDLYEATSVSRMLGQLRNLLEQIAANPNRNLSDFAYAENVGEPIPSFVPHANVDSPEPEAHELPVPISVAAKNMPSLWHRLRNKFADRIGIKMSSVQDAYLQPRSGSSGP